MRFFSKGEFNTYLNKRKILLNGTTTHRLSRPAQRDSAPTRLLFRVTGMGADPIRPFCAGLEFGTCDRDIVFQESRIHDPALHFRTALDARLHFTGNSMGLF
jgi:hypothetical protein